MVVASFAVDRQMHRDPKFVPAENGPGQSAADLQGLQRSDTSRGMMQRLRCRSVKLSYSNNSTTVTREIIANELVILDASRILNIFFVRYFLKLEYCCQHTHQAAQFYSLYTTKTGI
jgi:hypothetical protein